MENDEDERQLLVDIERREFDEREEIEEENLIKECMLNEDYYREILEDIGMDYEEPLDK